MRGNETLMSFKEFLKAGLGQIPALIAAYGYWLDPGHGHAGEPRSASARRGDPDHGIDLRRSHARSHLASRPP